MKLILVLMLCAYVAAAPKVEIPTPFEVNAFTDNSVEGRNILVNNLVRQLIAYLRRIINNGSSIFGIPPLDPLNLDAFHINVPAGLINLELDLKNIYMVGIGGFVVHRSHLDLSDLTFDLDISVPRVDVACEQYDLVGDLFTAIPLYGKGHALFTVEEFRFQAKLYLKQSANKQAVVIDRIANVAFALPSLKSELTGAIGGGDIDGIVNSIIEDVVVDYINRFQGAISLTASNVVLAGLNPILEQLDTWRYISVLLPRN